MTTEVSSPTNPIWASLVIPAWNEANRISPTLNALLAFAERLEPRSVEVLVINDGSADDTARVTRSHQSERLRLIDLNGHRGKGAATRRGIAESRGAHILILDADLPISESDMLKMFDALDGADIVAGTRLASTGGFSVPQPPLRRLGGKVFRQACKAAGLQIVTDPQCGAKVLRGLTVRPIAVVCVTDGFGFDIELLARSAGAGLIIVEQPVTWRHVPGSTLRPVRDGARTLAEVVRTRRRLRGTKDAT